MGARRSLGTIGRRWSQTQRLSKPPGVGEPPDLPELVELAADLPDVDTIVMVRHGHPLLRVRSNSVTPIAAGGASAPGACPGPWAACKQYLEFVAEISRDNGLGERLT
jgi:hypothetical protein